ncbi:MAG: 50S ribosomal protein L6 [Thermoplasmata archaeon]
MSTDDAQRSAVTIPLTKGVTLSVRGGGIVAKGPLGEVRRTFPSEALRYRPEGENATLELLIPANRKRSQALLHTWERHIANLVTGVSVGFEARMKVVAAHFPMKVSVKDNSLLIENFLGEKFPRTAPLVKGVSAKVEGDIVLLSGHDVEEVGQSAANIERATHIRDYDPRVFQDGIYIIEKARPKEPNA